MCAPTVCSLGEAADKLLTITAEVGGNGRMLQGVCESVQPGAAVKTDSVDDCNTCAGDCDKKYPKSNCILQNPNHSQDYCENYCKMGCTSYFSCSGEGNKGPSCTISGTSCKNDCVRPQLPPQNNPVVSVCTIAAKRGACSLVACGRGASLRLFRLLY